MDFFARFICDPVKIIKSIALAAISVGILVYVYFQATGGTDSDIVTETSIPVTLYDSIDAHAYIFRDESIINTGSSGTVVTVVSDGERVSKGQLLANVYSDADNARLQDEIGRINRRIDILSDSSVKGGFVISDLDKIDKDIDEITASIYKNTADGNMSRAIDDAAEFLVKLNKRDLIVNSGSDYTGELNALLLQRESLKSTINALSSPVYSTFSGYFYSDVDGYENIFDVSEVDEITLDNFDSYVTASPDESLASSGNVKIVSSFIWYMVCKIDSSQLAHVKEGYSYTLTFPENRDAEIKMELTKIISETNSTKALLVFRVNKLPSGFDYKRYQKAKIVKQSVEGLSVPKKALRVVDGTEGVYVLVGDVVRFRTVKRIAEKDNYYVVDKGEEIVLFDDESKDDEAVILKPISLYDNIIVSGKNLFDGKIVG